VTFLYWQLFGTLFPDHAEKLRAEIGPVAADSHEKSVADDLARKLRRNLSSRFRRACTKSSGPLQR